MTADWVNRSRQLTLRVRNFVEGRWHEGSGALMQKHSPRDGRLLCEFGAGEPEEADRAVMSARRAFSDGRWANLPHARRREILHTLAALIRAHRDEFALLECLDVGKPISDPLTFDVATAAGLIETNADSADKLHASVYGHEPSGLSYQLRRPIGVVAGIVGWNFPLVLAAAKIAPALAAGNSLVLKPSELTSFSAARVAELALEAGVPEGVLNVIHGGPAIGSALALHNEVSLVTFTGSTQTGKKLLIAAGQSNMKRLILECGGKAPNIVFDDSPDLEAVANAIVARAFWNQGQVCTASSRLLVQHTIRIELLHQVLRCVAQLIPGDPLSPDTRYGALVSQLHQRKVAAWIDSAARDGAKAVYRSEAPAPVPGGFYVPPVIFDEVAPDQPIAQEEIFGPVLSVISFRDEEEAIRIANSTIYGLSAIVWTRDLGRAHRMTRGIEAGWIVVNATGKPTGAAGSGVLSAGGHRQSGLGVEGGLEGLAEYTSSTAVQWFV